MTQKQTPKTFAMPNYMGSVSRWTIALGHSLYDLVTKLRNDLDNGAATFMHAEIAGIANVDADDLDDNQIRLYTDTSDANKRYLVARIAGSIYKVELT